MAIDHVEVTFITDQKNKPAGLPVRFRGKPLTELNEGELREALDQALNHVLALEQRAVTLRAIRSEVMEQANKTAKAVAQVVNAALHQRRCNDYVGPDSSCENCGGKGGALAGGACGACWESARYEADNDMSIALAALPEDWHSVLSAMEPR